MIPRGGGVCACARLDVIQVHSIGSSQVALKVTFESIK